jgi:hypothetical protein
MDILTTYPALANVAGALMLLAGLYLAWKGGDPKALHDAMEDLIPAGVAFGARMAAQTSTKADDAAVAFLRSQLIARGFKIPATLDEALRDAVVAGWQKHKIEVLGIPPHVDGSGAMSLIDSEKIKPGEADLAKAKALVDRLEKDGPGK